MKLDEQPLIARYQAITDAARRSTLHRALFAFLTAATTVGLSAWAALIVSGNRRLVLDGLLVLAFSLKALWVALVFWSSVIGFVLRHTIPWHRAAPSPACPDAEQPSMRVAIVMTVRGENPKLIVERLRTIKESVDGTGLGGDFDYFLLSDTSDAAMAAEEERRFSAWRATDHSNSRLIFRRREVNDGFKAGNLRDFCQRWGCDYELMVVLDADSVMTGSTIVQMVRIMQSNSRLGILQSMIDCVLPGSAFARIFEFDHRSVWHNYILGSAWWQGERGQYRGHNAVVRIRAYMAHCRLSDDLGDAARAHVMSYDQVEAALMHRAGYEVREIPVASGSYEGLPPALPDYLIRYQRWCQGNLTNLKLLRLPGLSMMDRYHLVGVAQRFLAWPAFVIFVFAAILATASWPADVRFPMAGAALLYSTFLLLYFGPRLLGMVDAIRAGRARREGVVLRHVVSVFIAGVFVLLFVPIAMLSTSPFLFRRLWGRGAVWAPQQRDNYDLSWRDAAAELWPITAVALMAVFFLAITAPSALPWFLPFFAGPLLAIPFAAMTSSRQLGERLRQACLCTMAEELVRPKELDHARHHDPEYRAP